MKNKPRVQDDFKQGYDENNLAEFPLALLGDAAAGQTTLEFQDEIDDWESGVRLTRKVTIMASEKWGLPTSKDEDVLLALIQLTKARNNFTSPEVVFTKHEIIKILGWQNRGWAYDRIEEALNRWKSVSIHYANAWRDFGKRRWRDSSAIGVIEYFEFTDGRKAATRDEQSRFVWNSVLFQSFQAGYLKKLDFETYRNLERATAKRAYRFLDKRFFHKPRWEFDLHHFATQKLGLSKNYDTGQLKAKLDPAFAELEAIGFIKPVTYRKLARKRWNVSIAKRSATTAKSAATDVVTDSSTELAERLIAYGVAARTAKSMVKSYDAALIDKQLGYFGWLRSKNDSRVANNPPGFLVTAIKDDFPPSADYMRQVERSKQPPRSRTKVSTQPVHRRVVEPATICDQTVDAFVSNQPETILNEWLVAALAETSKFTRNSYERVTKQNGKLLAELRGKLLRDYVIRHRLHENPTVAA